MSSTKDSTQPAARRVGYIPAFDSLRGLGLMSVVLFHYTLFLRSRSSPGWFNHTGPLVLSLQIFFVLSGVLITSLLVSEHQRSGSISLKAFYLRRSRRLGPALVVLLPLMVIAELFWTGDSASSPLGVHPWVPVLTVALFLGNWVDFTRLGGLGWLGPAWSLAVEEQFYLTWPSILRLCLNRGVRRRTLYAGLGVATILGIGVAELLFRRYGYTKTYVATPTQLPCVLAGCGLGYEITANPLGRLTRLLRRRTTGAVGLLGVIAVSYELSAHSRYVLRGGYLFYAFFGCLLVGHCFVAVDREWVLTKALTWKPLVLAGKMSYEAYLIHVVVISAMLDLFPHLGVYPTMLADTAIVAAASAVLYYLVDQPIRRYGWRAYFSRERKRTVHDVVAPRPPA